MAAAELIRFVLSYMSSLGTATKAFMGDHVLFAHIGVVLLIFLVRAFTKGIIFSILIAGIYAVCGFLLFQSDEFSFLFRNMGEKAGAVFIVLTVTVFLPVRLLLFAAKPFLHRQISEEALEAMEAPIGGEIMQARGSVAELDAKNKAAHQTESKQVMTIMMTDIQGYSAKMEKDEAATYELLKEHNAIMRKQLAAHRGKEIKTIGDAFMVTFPAPLDAVKCGIAMQKEFVKYNANRQLHEQIKIRIGVHSGEVIVTKNDCFGEGVNIAARIEPKCEPGSIAISSDVQKEVVNKIQAGFQSLGILPMKNIAHPPEVFLVRYEG
jgi:class 3 adenylate cyclase